MTRPSNPEVLNKGLDIRRSVLGAGYVDNSIQGVSDLTADMRSW